MATNELMMPKYGIVIVRNPEIELVKFDELRTWLNGLLSRYKNLVIDESQCKEAKKEIAALNKIKAEISQYSKNIIEQLSVPIEKIEDVVSQITVEIDATYSALKEQIDGFAEKAREEKKARVLEMFEGLCKKFSIQPWTIEIKKTWTNASTSFSKIDEELTSIVQTRVSEILREQESKIEEKKEAPVELEPQEQQTTLSQSSDNILSNNLGKVSSPATTYTTMNIVVTWSAESDAEIRALLHQIKAKAVQVSARKIANPPIKVEQKPVSTPVIEKNVLFCKLCSEYAANPSTPGKGLCKKTGELVEDFTAGC